MPHTAIDEILERLRATERELQAELDRLLDAKREQFRYTLERGKVRFEQGVKRLQREQRTGVLRYVLQAPILHLLSAPIVYGMAIPLLLLDLSLSIYQHSCFRIYHIPRVRRRDYLVLDRHQLAYLNIIEKFNCVYCGYGNGLIEYAREIFGRTEQFWCPIKHAQRTLDPHARTRRFFDYGDGAAYRSQLPRIRRAWDADRTPD